MLSRRDLETIARCEEEYLREPKQYQPKRCEECGEYPDDDFLYNHDGDWLCQDCLLHCFPRRDVYLDDWSDDDE